MDEAEDEGEALVVVGMPARPRGNGGLTTDRQTAPRPLELIGIESGRDELSASEIANRPRGGMVDTGDLKSPEL